MQYTQTDNWWLVLGWLTTKEDNPRLRIARHRVVGLLTYCGTQVTWCAVMKTRPSVNKLRQLAMTDIRSFIVHSTGQLRVLYQLFNTLGMSPLKYLINSPSFQYTWVNISWFCHSSPWYYCVLEHPKRGCHSCVAPLNKTADNAWLIALDQEREWERRVTAITWQCRVLMP